MLDRRELLSSAAITIAASALPWPALADAPPDPKLAALFDAFFQEGLRRNPEGATQLGLDTGANADLRGKLRDESAAGIAQEKVITAQQIAQLKSINTHGLSVADRINYDTVLYTRESAARLIAFDFGGAGASPYVVSQQTGAYQSVPDFLDTKHRIETAADADAYLSRLEAFAVQIDDNTARMRVRQG